MKEIINVGRCMGCRKGIYPFTFNNGIYNHLDMFYSPEEGALMKCGNSDVIGNYLIENKESGMLMPTEDLKELYIEQENWWQDIIYLANTIFDEDHEKIGAFFNEGEKGNMVWNLSNVDIENKLLALADVKGMVITKEDYECLLKFNQ